MGYVALYNKYRPQTFDDVVGQEVVVQTLQKMISCDKIANGYLLVGNRGLGKTTLAKIIAKAINCESGDEVPCNECASCKAITNGSSFDMVEMDAASNRGVDAIRDMIINKVQYKPRGKYKVYIVDECHMLTTEAWNALLKTLETPPPYVVFIFCTTNPEKIPKTIISRLQTYYLKDMTNDDIVKRLKYICKNEGFKADNEALYAIARYAKGGMRDSISALDQISAFTNHITQDDVLTVLGILSEQDCYDIFKNMISKDTEGLAVVLSDITNEGKDISDVYNMLQTYARISVNVLIGIKFTPSEISGEMFETLKKEVPKLVTTIDMQRYIELLVDNDMNYKYAYDKIVVLLSMTSKLSKTDKTTKVDIDAIVKKVLSMIGTVPSESSSTEKVVNDIRKKLSNTDDDDDEPNIDAVRDIKKWFKKGKNNVNTK